MISLMIWTAVASNNYFTPYDWRELMTVTTPAACHTAAQSLGLNPKQFRCVSKDTGESK
jgi:hypothetical protein